VSRLSSQLSYYQKQLADVEAEIALVSKAPDVR
jgi:hypothetical protein